MATSGGRKRDGCKRDISQVKVYLHAVTDEQAALLTGKLDLLQEIKLISGAELDVNPNASPVPGMVNVCIRGVSSQIEAAIKLISQKTGAKETLSEQAQTFWIQWVENAFPDLDSRAYFLPPVYFNRVPMTTHSVAGQGVLVNQPASSQPGKLTGPEYKFEGLLMLSKTQKEPNQDNSKLKTPVTVPSTFTPQPSRVQESDIRDDTAMQRVLFCLQKLSENTKDVFVGISQLQFGQYLGEPCYAAAARQLPSLTSLPSSLPPNWRQGDFDVLLIHRHYGFVVCEVKAFGDNVKELNMTQQNIDNNIRKKLKDAMTQLDKAEAMLSHLVSDIAPGLRITKTIAVPNLTGHQVQQAISDDLKIIKDLSRCLDAVEAPDITDLCLCSDQLSDPKTPWDVSENVLGNLENWWQRRVAVYGHDSHMTCDIYKKLVARFCGPATTVTVPCTSPPRLCIKTLHQAVWCTGEFFTAQITLFPEQVDLLNEAPSRLFVAGPPGTGKTVVLLLMALEWMRCGHHVHIVKTYIVSRAASSMLYNLLLNSQTHSGQLHLLEYNMAYNEEVEKAVNDLSQAAKGELLYVIADEAYGEDNFKTFCEKLLNQIPRLHLWAASCFHGDAPPGWQVEYLTRPLRSPPAVVREVKRDNLINYRRVQEYSERGVPDHTDGPPVIRLYHRGQDHMGYNPADCKECGREVAGVLKDKLHVGVPETTGISASGCSTPPCLQWRDVLVLICSAISEMGVVTGLKEAGIPVRVISDDIDDININIDDVATARSDVVWVTDGLYVQGLERKIVVCLDPDVYMTGNKIRHRLHYMSRCTSQLVIVSR